MSAVLSIAPPEFQAIIVDLDGTMVDTLGDFFEVLRRTLLEMGLPLVDRDFIARTVGKGSEHLIRSSLAQVGADPQVRYDEAWARYQAHYQAVNGEFAAVFPGVTEGLAGWRRRGLRLACLTNKPTAYAKVLLARTGLALHFEQVFGGDAFERKKPDPLPLLRTCEALGVAPAHTLMVGDSSNDAQAAHAAGCRVALVTYGYNHGKPIQAVPAHAWVDRLDAL